MQLIRLAALVTFGVAHVAAADFTLRYPGAGLITVHTSLTYEGKGERLIATARNESGLPISHARICILSYSMKEGCLFELWNAEVWAPGKELNWNIVSMRKVPYLKHDVIMRDESANPAAF